MLATAGVLLFSAGYLVLSFAHYACRQRPASFWASEAGILVVLGPSVLILMALGGGCIAKFWVDGGLQNMGRLEAALVAALVVLIVVFERLTRLRQRAARQTPA